MTNLGNEPILVHHSGLLLSLSGLWNFRPDFLHILENPSILTPSHPKIHVAVSVKRLHVAEQLVVVTHVDQHLHRKHPIQTTVPVYCS